MNLCSYSRSAVPACDVVCPKPRRVGPFIPTAITDDCSFTPCRFQFNFPPETSNSKAGTEVLDLILAKGNSVAEESNSNTAPPYFWGSRSPPSRASNPLIQDARFKNDTTPREPPPVAASPSASAAARAPIRMKVGHKPPPVRIEGFDCLGRDGPSRSISAVA